MATAARQRTQRKEYLNTTQGWVGAIQINRRGEDEPLAVAPGGRVFLTDEEVELTAQSHQRAEDSPFVAKEVVYRDAKTGDEISRATIAPLQSADEFRRSGGQILPDVPQPD